MYLGSSVSESGAGAPSNSGRNSGMACDKFECGAGAEKIFMDRITSLEEALKIAQSHIEALQEMRDMDKESEVN